MLGSQQSFRSAKTPSVRFGRGGLLATCALLSIIHQTDALGQWAPDGNRITSWGANWAVPLADDRGGAILLWNDSRPIGQVRVGRIDPDGSMDGSWPDSGLAVAPVSGSQTGAVLCEAANGGVFVAWSGRDDLNGDNGNVYVQRVSSDGTVPPAWPAAGVLVGRSQGQDWQPHIAPDGLGGLFVAWTISPEIRLQRVTSEGQIAPGWPDSGLVLGVGGRQFPQVASDGTGGAFVVWQDYIDARVYAQHVTGQGAIVSSWPPDGLQLAPVASGGQTRVRVTTDGQGGLFATWEDTRYGARRLYAQHIGADGLDALWPASGLPLCSRDFEQFDHAMAPDGLGGAYVVFVDNSASHGTYTNLYCTKIGASETGSPVSWGCGVLVCGAARGQALATLSNDNAGGVFITWTDQRFEASESGQDIYAHHLNLNMELHPAWPEDGLRICGANDFQIQSSVAFVGQGAIVAWEDGRPDTLLRAYDRDVYVGYVGLPEGVGVDSKTLPVGASRIQAVLPNPSSGRADVDFQLTRAGRAGLRVSDVRGRTVAVVPASFCEAGKNRLTWSGRTAEGVKPSSGVYFVTLEVDGAAEDQMKVILLP